MSERETPTPEAIDLMTAQIESEIALLVPAHGNKARARYYNNFANHLSFSDRHEISNSRWMAEFSHSTKTNREIFPPEDHELFSNRYLNITAKQFFAEIDLAMEKVGVSGVKVDQMIILARENGEDNPYEQELLDYIAPVYIHLRLMGFNKEEIVS